jgi:hypothetical protein
MTGTKQWHVADFGTYQLWTNGTYTVVRGADRLFAIQALPYHISSMCNYRGRLVAGGFGGDYANFVAWSKIGRVGDLTKLLQPEDITNESGYMPIPFAGNVLSVKEMVEAVIVYGSEGIVALYPAQQTLGMKVISHTGISGRDVVSGDIYSQMYTSVDGRLYRLRTGKLTPELLDYKEFIGAMTIANIVTSYDDSLDDFYISDGTSCYLMSPYGMSKIMDAVTSVCTINGVLHGIRTRGSDTSGYITTTMFDFGMRAIKTIMGIQIDGEGTSLTAGVKYRFGHTDSFTTSTMKAASSIGSVTPIVSGVDLKLKVASTSYTTFKLDELNVRWKLSDKRNIRGIYDVSAKNA